MGQISYGQYQPQQGMGQSYGQQHERGFGQQQGHGSQQGYGMSGQQDWGQQSQQGMMGGQTQTSSGYGGFRGGMQAGWGQTETSRSRKGPKNYARSDERIREMVCERLVDEQGVDVSEVSIEVKNGRVELEGTVPSRQMRHRIEDIVDDCWGVQDIENRLRVQTQQSGQSGQESRSGSEQGRSGSSSGGFSGLSGSSSTKSGTESRGKGKEE
jgi:osmotically-inducible protein OsmY